MNRPIPGIIISTLFLMFLLSCKVGKQPVRRQARIIDSAKMKRYGLVTVDTPGAQPKTATTKPARPAVSEERQQLIEKLVPVWQRQTDFNTFSGKARMHYAGMGQKNEFTANFRIQKDNVIWISVTAFLVNVARIYVTPDSIQMINYLQKEAYKMHISEANKLLPAAVDFSTMQNLIIGNALITTGKPTNATDFGGTLTIEVANNEAIQQLTFNKTDTTLRTLQMRTHDNKTQGLIQYGNYEMVTGRRFATSRAINLENAGEPYYLDMNFNNAEFDQQLDFPFTIPKNYELK